jgi:lipopolysaccharide transport system permease protein
MNNADRVVTVRRPGARMWRPAGNVRELAQYTDLLRTLSAHRIRVRYKQSVLGLAWAIVQPLSMMLIFTLVFGRIARVSTDGVPYSLFAFTGLLLWSFLSTSLNNATQALVSHAQLVTKVYFPREILPLSYVAAALFDLLVGSIVLVAMLAWYGRPITWHVLLVAPVIATTAMLATALAFILAALQVRFRDIGLAVPLALYLWMFCTPVAYPLSAVPPRYMPAFRLNPMTDVIETFRDVILRNRIPSPPLPVVPAVFAALLLLLAYALFKRAEATMADVV